MPKTKETEAQKIARLRSLREARDGHVSSPPTPRHLRTPFDLSSDILFGKHYGSTLHQVLNKDIGWVTWALENINDFVLSDEAEREYNALLDPRRPIRRGR